MRFLDAQQGTQLWLDIKAKYPRSASVAPAMMGYGHVKRNELIHMVATGSEQEFSDYVKKNVIDRGHEIEGPARELAEAKLGETLYPAVVASDDEYLLASLDGMTIDCKNLWENKQWNAETARLVGEGICPPKHYWQIVQQLLITGADKCLFMVCDGTEANCTYMWVMIGDGDAEKLVAGWHQFDKDVVSYVPPEIIPAAVAAPQEALPSLSVQVDGAVAVRDNLAVFGDAMRAYIERLNKKPETDDDFATLDASAKLLRDAQSRIKAAKDMALGQVEAIDAMKRTADLLEDLARTTAIELENIVKREKETRRVAIIQAGKHAIKEHVTALNAEIGYQYVPMAVDNFAGVVKGLKSLDSIKNAIDCELANLKIAADAAAKKILQNLKMLEDFADGYQTLFPDTAALVLKASDDLAAVITARISEHKAAEEKRLADIREQERIKAEAKAVTEPAALPVTTPVATPTAPVVAAAPELGRPMTNTEIREEVNRILWSLKSRG